MNIGLSPFLARLAREAQEAEAQKIERDARNKAQTPELLWHDPRRYIERLVELTPEDFYLCKPPPDND